MFLRIIGELKNILASFLPQQVFREPVSNQKV